MAEGAHGSGGKAAVVFSMDFEIGWGDVMNPRWRERERAGVYDRLRSVLPELLAAMDDFDIPMTWATVGAMFDEPDKRDFSHLPIRYREHVGSVLAEAKPSSFNGRDLFEMVIGARTRHHIASHSYSHVPFTYDGMNDGIIRAEMQRFAGALAAYGRTTDRFVFPENREAHHEALAASGIAVARVSALNRFRNRWAYLLTTPFVPPPLVTEERDASGVVRQHESMLFADSPLRMTILGRRVRLGLDHALREGGTLHLWGHPFNYAASDRLKDMLLGFLRNVARLRDAGQIEVRLM